MPDPEPADGREEPPLTGDEPADPQRDWYAEYLAQRTIRARMGRLRAEPRKHLIGALQGLVMLALLGVVLFGMAFCVANVAQDAKLEQEKREEHERQYPDAPTCDNPQGAGPNDPIWDQCAEGYDR